MLGVNRGYVKDDSTNHFGYELGYDKTTNIISGQSYAAAQYNGNITGTTWKSKGDAEKRKYDFTYDAVNRILSADFNQYTSGSFSKSAGVDFSLSGMTYDANGNILSMKQRGLQLTGSVTIDSLSYNYAAGSNKLLNVIDGLNDPATRLGDFRTSTLHPASGSKLTSTEDYEYDDNGNMVKDLNKDIVTYAGTDGIVYNHLNLPQTITVRKSDGNKGTIVYTYDAAGIKLKKTVYEPGVDTTTTLYIGGAVLQNDSLQFIAHEEGRVRLAPANTATCTPEDERFVFDYFIKDHLGNVRMVLTEQQEDICYLPATVEDAAWQTESHIYDITDGRRIDKATTGASESSFGNKLYRVHGGNTGEKTGLGMVLKVMSGDQVKITAESYYTLPGGGAGSPLTLGLTELLTAFTGGGPVAATHGSVSTSTVSGIGANTTSLSNFISDTTAPANTAEAFLNWILFDEQLKYVAGGADPVNTGGGYKEHIKFINSPVNITKNGFLYIYVSNESDFAVFFDNLAVTHTPGAIVEETHYYPFGLTMKGISSKALALFQAENNRKYNGIEKENDLQLDIYDARFRELDAQVGRWWQVDPKTENMEMWSPYVSNYDNPITYSDPLGDEGQECCQGFFDAFLQVGKDITTFAIGVGNAFASNQMGGIGRGDPNSYSNSHDAIISSAGQATGDVLTLLAVAVVDIGGPIVMGGSVGAAAVPVAGLMVHQTTVAGPAAIRGIIGNSVNAVGSKNPKTKESAETGQEAHRQRQAELEKQGAQREVTIDLKDGTRVRKDAVEKDGTAVIIKPNTKSGRASAKKREDLLKKNDVPYRTEYYNPFDPRYMPGSDTYIGLKKRINEIKKRLISKEND